MVFIGSYFSTIFEFAKGRISGLPSLRAAEGGEAIPRSEAALFQARPFRGSPLPVITREYLAAMKLASGRGKDLDDLAYLILHTPVSLKAARRIIVEHLGPYAGREFDSFVEEVKALGRRA